MISFLTGDRQAGKTTWLSELIPQITRTGTPIWGFITPAVFDDDEKTGIDVTLLPIGGTFPFARRATGNRDEYTPNAPQRHWDFSEEIMLQLNIHMANGMSLAFPSTVLIIDELGPLELEQGGGVQTAVRVLDMGKFENAIVVIRPELLQVGIGRWGKVTPGGYEIIFPGQKPAFL